MNLFKIHAKHRKNEYDIRIRKKNVIDLRFF